MADNRCIVYIYKVAAVVKHYLEQTSSEPRGALRGKVEDKCMLSQLSECWGVSETKIVIKIIITSVQSLHITIRNINRYLYSLFMSPH